MIRTTFGLAVGLGLVMALVAPVQADSILETVAHDTGLEPRPDLQNNNNNGSDRIIVGGTTTNNDYSVPILRWTLSTVPLDHQAVTDGTMTLTVYPFADHSSSVGQTVNVHVIKAANAGWLESKASWNHKDKDTPVAWSGGPGLGNPGDGYEAIPVNSFIFSGGSTVALTIPQSVINDWIANPSDNAGLIMFMQGMDGTERFLRFWSNTGAVPATLGFETALVPEPVSLALLALGGAFILQHRRNRD